MQSVFVSAQGFPFMQRAQQRGIDWVDDLDNAIGQGAAADLDGWEPIVRNPDQADLIAGIAARHGLVLRSVYVGGAMHEEEEGRASVENMVAIAERAARHGTRFVVINPNPIAWGSTDNKDDRQLRLQLRLLTETAERIAATGLRLCYHTHDAEMRASAREFHHMMINTDPDVVRLCLDPHWIWRGAGNSEVALHDMITLYGARVDIVHLRQSQDDIWDETVGPGDIDYDAVMDRLEARKANPLLVIERAVETGTPQTMTDVEAHRRSADYIRARLVRGQSASAAARS